MAKDKEVMIQTKEMVSVESFITKAIETNTPVETMERLFALRKEVKAEMGKEAFDDAMSDFQGECPVIKKQKKGGSTNAGNIAYMYAPLDIIVTQTKDLIKKNGFSYAIKAETKDKLVKATCIVKHRLGHSEESSFEVPLGTKTSVMNDSQVVAAALTFAKRYAFCNAFGILTGDDDGDGKIPATGKAIVPAKTPNVKSQIMFLVKELGIDPTSDVEKEIKRLTKLDPKKEENLVEIKNRLEILVQESK